MPKITLTLSKDEIAKAIIEKYAPNANADVKDVKFNVSDTSDDGFGAGGYYELISADVVTNK